MMPEKTVVVPAPAVLVSRPIVEPESKPLPFVLVTRLLNMVGGAGVGEIAGGAPVEPVELLHLAEREPAAVDAGAVLRGARRRRQHLQRDAGRP